MSGATDIKLLAKIARMYYEEDMTSSNRKKTEYEPITGFKTFDKSKG